MYRKSLQFILKVAVLTSIATASFAEDVPVYDADNFPPAFDGQVDSGSGDRQESSYSPPPSRSMSLDQRLSKVEQQVVTLQHKESSGKIDTLQTEIQTLRGQVEQLTHQLQTQNRQNAASQSAATDSSSQAEVKALRAQVEQMSKQLQEVQKPLSTASTVSVAPAAKSKPTKSVVATTTTTDPTAAKVGAAIEKTAKTDAQPNVAEEQQIYQTAYDLIKAEKYEPAITALQKMLRKYPTGQFAANAHFWLGEIYAIVGKNEQSANEFAVVIKNYPDSPKISDAQLKLGLIYAAQFKWAEAKTVLKKVVNQYPGTSTARTAADQLKQIKRAGH